MSEINTDTFVGPSFSLANRLARMLWGICWFLLFRPSPRPMHFWRRAILRAWGASISPGVHIYPSAQVWAPWLLMCDSESGIGERVIIYNQGKVSIGRRAVISQGVHLCAGTHDYTKMGMPLITRPITIGADAWLAAECFVMPGVNIGEGAVIGARSLVTKDMPAWHICVGHPCAPLKPRERYNRR